MQKYPKIYIRVVIIITLVFIGSVLIRNNFTKPYEFNENTVATATDCFNFNPVNVSEGDVVVPKDMSVNADQFSNCYTVFLVNDTEHEVLVAKNTYDKIYFASITKLTTIMVALDYINANGIDINDFVTVNKKYDLRELKGGPFDMGIGSKITIKNLLHGILISSNNYYTLILADYVAGSEEAFVNLMNQKVEQLGCVNTHYANPHGLDMPNHYSCAYDIYLIIKAASKYEIINEIDQLPEYDYTYLNPSGNPIDIKAPATNQFVYGNAKLQPGVEILAWKTGTTDNAGKCLVMYFKYKDENYVSLITVDPKEADLYDCYVKLLTYLDTNS